MFLWLFYFITFHLPTCFFLNSISILCYRFYSSLLWIHLFNFVTVFSPITCNFFFIYYLSVFPIFSSHYPAVTHNYRTSSKINTVVRIGATFLEPWINIFSRGFTCDSILQRDYRDIESIEFIGSWLHSQRLPFSDTNCFIYRVPSLIWGWKSLRNSDELMHALLLPWRLTGKNGLILSKMLCQLLN